MLSLKKTLIKRTAFLLAMLMFFMTIISSIPAFAADEVTVAEWSYTAVPDSAEIPATGGENQADAVLTGSQNITPTFSTSSLCIAGWSVDDYWEINLSTEGFKDLTLSAKTRSSGTGPRNFKVQYSTDGGDTFSDSISTYAVTGSSLSKFMTDVDLPDETENQENLIIRFIVADDTRSSGSGTIASGGTSNINNIIITGIADDPDEEGGKVADVTADPDSGEVDLGDTVTLSTETEDAVIMYSTDDGETYEEYTEEIILDTLPATIMAYAEKSGMEDSDTVTFEYTQAVITKVKDVTASPDSGEAALGDKVTLSTETDGAAIMYSTDGETYKEYTEDIILDTLPATLMAYAQKQDLEDSDIKTFGYTQLKTAAVTANPGSGKITAGTKVELTCETIDSVINYSIDNGESYNQYSEPIEITSLPISIIAYAEKENLADSDPVTFNYQEKINGEYNVYFGQLHSHTNISDGQGSIADAFSHAEKAENIDFLAVTDHSNSFDDETKGTMAGSSGNEWKLGHDTADQYTDESFVGIYGFEMTWSNGTGHINTFNTPGFESRNTAKFKAADGLQQYYNILKDYPDSISQFNHPGTTFGDFNDFGGYDTQIDSRISLIEVGNGEGTIRDDGYFPSYEYYTRALDKGWHVAPTNNQDNHKSKWGDANTARSVILADSLTRDNIYDAMRNMRVYATEDNDLSIKYTLNDEIMGSSLSSKPDSVNITVDLDDPDNEALGKVSVIVNGGKVAASKILTSSDEIVNFTLEPDYSYYYIRVDQADKDIAVTAPVWIGKVEKVGIAKTTASTAMPVKNQEITIKSDLYNNESEAFLIDSLTYTVDGEEIHSASGLSSIPSLGTVTDSFPYTFTSAGNYTVNVQLRGTLDGVEKVFNDVLKLSIADPDMVSRVVVDAAHFNDYVYGYYANNINNFTTLANGEQIVVDVEKTKLTDDVLEDAQMLVISAPAKKTGSANGISYTPSVFTDEDIAVIKKYVDNGGNLIVCGLADYQDGTGVYQSSTQLNKLLSAIGAASRINNDEVIDNITNGGQTYRLAFNQYDMDSPYLQGVDPNQNYSFYSGCSISLDSDSLASGNTKWLVKGHSTTESFDSNPNLTGIALPQGSIYALAVEKLSGGGNMFIGGTVFISDFEVKAALDNYQDLQNSNYNITMNILDSIKKNINVTPISTIRKAAKGESFVAEGIVTAGTTAGNAFYDTIYIQDNTGGLNIYPVTGMDIKVGQKIRVTGTVDEFEGDLELRVTDVRVTDTSIHPVSPKVLTAKDAMDSKYSGLLVNVVGTAAKVEINNGIVTEIMVRDSSNTQARIFFNDYIGYSNAGSPLLENIKAGDKISAVGIASVDTAGPRLRVRDRSEITVKTDVPVNPVPDVPSNPAPNKPSDSSSKPSSSENKTPVSVPSSGNSTGWSNINEVISTAGTGESVNVSMNGTTEIPQEVLSDIKGKDVNLVLDFGIYQWTINGMDVASAGTLDLGVSFNAGVVNSDLVNNLANERPSMQLTLNHTGTFGFTGTLSVKLPSEKAGLYANLFYYNPVTNALEFQTSGIINSDGSTELNFSHASDYVIVLDNAPMGKEISAGAGVADNTRPIAENTYPYAEAVVVLTAGMIIYKKNKIRK